MAWELASGKSEQDVRSTIQAKYGPITAETADELREIVQAGIDAGEYYKTLNPDELANPDKIPTIDDLFGGNDAGRRVKWRVIWTDPESGIERQLDLIFGYLPTMQQVTEAVKSLTLANYQASPQKWGAGSGAETTAQDIKPIFIGKSY